MTPGCGASCPCQTPQGHGPDGRRVVFSTGDAYTLELVESYLRRNGNEVQVFRYVYRRPEGPGR